MYLVWLPVIDVHVLAEGLGNDGSVGDRTLVGREGSNHLSTAQIPHLNSRTNGQRTMDNSKGEKASLLWSCTHLGGSVVRCGQEQTAVKRDAQAADVSIVSRECIEHLLLTHFL